MKHSFKKKLDFLKLHIEDSLFISDIKEIRVLKMFNHSKLEVLEKKLPYVLLFMSNDLILYKASHLVFYSIKMKSTKSVFLLGLSIKYLENGTKEESRIYFEALSILNYCLIKSKYNIVLVNETD